MTTVGLKDLFVAAITVGAEGAETYGTPRRLAKAITAGLEVEYADGSLFADDAVDVYEKEFVSGELTLNVNDLLPADCAFLFGHEQDTDEVVYAGENDDPPYVAIGFRAKKPGGKYRYIWLYKVKFSAPNEEYQTKGDGVEFKTPEIVGKFIKRPDGLWKADYTALPTDSVATDWFTEVREKNAAA